MSDSRTGLIAGASLGAVACVAAALYTIALDRVPIHLHHDEIYFGLLADSIANTLRDPHGRLLPILFQMGDSLHWYPPLLIYFNALWLAVLPLTDVTVRLPNAFIGTVDVVLIYFVAARMFGSRQIGLAAAGMLALTPAHFINSRIATDCLYPVTFILGWLLLLQRYLDRPTNARLLAASGILGVGVYGYVASVVMMPVYALITIAVLYWERKPARSLALSLAAFALPLVFGIAFLLTHPDVIANYSEKYELAETGLRLNAFQQLREALTPWNISDHLNLFHSSFSPGYLFVTGGSNLAHSTRLAGVFLAPLAVLLLVGLIDAVRRPTMWKVVITAGFLTAPLAATIVPEEFAIPRMLGLLPFGVLLASAGLARMLEAPNPLPVRAITAAAGGLLAALGGGYGGWMLIRHGHASAPALLMAAAGIAIALTGAACARRRDWQPAALLILLLMPAQFAVFAADYFGDYRARSAARYEHNVRGALEQAIAIHDRSPGGRFYINDDILFVRAFWDYYLRVFVRPELRDRAIWFNSENGLPPDVAAGSIVVTDISDRALARLATVPSLVRVAEATDPVPGSDPPTERATFAIFQKR